MITMFAMTAVLVGAVLGQRFKVLILGPAIIVGLAVILVIGVVRHDTLCFSLLVIALITTALQIGYLCGVVIRFVVAAARVGRNSPRTIAVAQRSAR